MKRALPLILAIIAATAYAEAQDLLTVTRVIDGDTVELSDGQKVRLIGVDTPESHPSRKLTADAKRTHQDEATIRALGKRATQFTSSLLMDKKVRLEYDQTKKDRYGRTLAYLILPDGKNANLEIVRQGFGSAYTRFPFKYMDKFRAAEAEAREQKRGLWE